MSGKMAVLACMLEKLRPMGDRIVVVSNSTQVLDLIGTLCQERNVRHCSIAEYTILLSITSSKLCLTTMARDLWSLLVPTPRYASIWSLGDSLAGVREFSIRLATGEGRCICC